MSENWQIFIIGILLGVVQLLLVGVLGWIAFELRRLNTELNYRVHYKDCDRRMREHERRINKLEEIG